MRRIALGLLLLTFVPALHGREINSKDDLVRLRGFGEHERFNRDFERERLKNAHEVEVSRLKWERQKEQSLAEYRHEQKKQQAKLDDRSPEYRDDQKDKREWDKLHEKERRAFMAERDARRREERQTVSLTEERELGVDQDPLRVDWKKRRFVMDPTSKAGGSGGGRFTGSPGGAAGEAPPPEFMGAIPPPPPPDFYDAEAPPPPPPPPMDPGFNGGYPGGFEENMPQPPVFDEPPEF